MNTKRRWSALLLLFCVCVRAEPTDTGIYPRAFFDRYSPQTALDMVRRVPGFALEDVGDERGFGATAGNVLIDGQRPTVKSGGLEDALARIPAGAVAQVEILRGVDGGSDAAAQTVLLNLVRVSGARSSAWLLTLERSSDPDMNVAGDAAFAQALGAWDLSTRVDGLWSRWTYERYDRFDYAADGGLLRVQREGESPSLLAEGFISNEARRALGDGALVINSRIGRADSTRLRDRLRYADRSAQAQFLGRQRIDTDEVDDTAELGLEWARPVAGDWTLKLIGLSGRNADAETQQSRVEIPDSASSAQQLVTDERDFEGITRATLARARSARLAPDFGLELAFNQLDSRLSADADAPIRTRVEERRAEVFANLAWRVARDWTLESGLAVEHSEIQVSGGRRNRQDFAYLKPLIAISVDTDRGMRARLALQRRVGQLEFDDLADSGDLSDARALAGNAALRPDQRWRSSASLDLRARTRGALSLELFHERIDDVLEHTAFADGRFGLANLGPAEQWGLVASASLPLSAMMRGGLIETTLDWRDASFDDPLSGRRRVITDFVPLSGTASLRQDLQSTRLAWGVSVKFGEDLHEFYADEQRLDYSDPQWTAFVETTRLHRLKLRLEYENIGGLDSGEIRSFHEPDRSGVAAGRQEVSRLRGSFVRISLSRAF
ncbi:MAG: TonB-dependent receptor plug domain-containing protein [Panacagrimonas sp.]